MTSHAFILIVGVIGGFWMGVLVMCIMFIAKNGDDVPDRD